MDSALQAPDVAVVGGGAVGLYLAKRLSDTGLATALVEVPSRSSEHLRRSVSSVGGGAHRGVDDGWSVGLGGTTELWGGQLWPWDPDEFDGSDVDGIAAWPEEVAARVLSTYPLVIRHLGLSLAHEEIHRGVLQQRQHNGGLRHGRLRHSSWMNRQERRFVHNRSLAAARSSVSLVEMRVDRAEEGRAGWTLIGQTAEGENSLLHARRVVFAAGTLGTYRILSRSGLGQPGALGVGFMDHVSSPVASFRIVDPSRFRSHAAPLWHRGVLASPRLIPVARRTGIGSPPGYGHWEIGVPDWLPLADLKRALATRRLGSLRASGPAVLGHLPEVAATLAGAATGRHRPVLSSSTVRLRVDVQQGESTTRRLEYDEKEDTVLVHWDVSAAERDNIRIIGRALLDDLDLRAIGLDLVDVDETDAHDIFHMMGGAALGGDVVDRRTRLRAAGSAYVAGAITFPSGGLANPTMTALSLAELTVKELAGG